MDELIFHFIFGLMIGAIIGGGWSTFELYRGLLNLDSLINEKDSKKKAYLLLIILTFANLFFLTLDPLLGAFLSGMVLPNFAVLAIIRWSSLNEAK